MIARRHALALAALLPSAALLPLAARAHGDKPAPVGAPVAEAAGIADARAYFTDTELLSQDGRRLRFFSDLLDGRNVLINVVFTQCKDACPLITQQLKAVRQRLGARAKDFHFVSLSSDPGNDTPQALKRFAAKQGADVAGWTFLTGAPANVEQVLKKLGQFAPDPQNHSTLLIAGNVPAKRWSKVRPDAPIDAIVQRLLLLAEASPAPARPSATP
jgi:protein SCO1